MRISSAAFLEFQGGAMWQRPHGTPSNVPLDFIEGIGEVSLASPISTKLRPRLKWKMIQLMSLTSAVRGSFKGMGWGSSTLEFRYFNSYAFLKFDWIFRIRMEYLELVLLYLRTKKIRYNWFSRYIYIYIERHSREDLARLVHGRFQSDLIPLPPMFLFVSDCWEKSQLEQILECERLFP